MNIVEPIKNKLDLQRIEVRLARRSKRDLLMFELGINSGLRISDILNLNIKDVRNQTHIHIVEKKTKKLKSFPLNKKLKDLIEPYVEDKSDDEPLFKTRFNHRLDRFQAYKILNAVCQSIGLRYKVGTHSLRKTFGYHHYKQFKDIALLQKIFNHSSTKTTLRYIGIEQEEIDKSYKNFVL
ncbi:hypothetical protein BKH43_02485 [Helicobacter sp. 13S00401-1]|uniref:site-specific integrase n=1 Tax=Helicobacter sp. 13S00401-1 TaxID=1905758 RepID=UPI000BA5D66E|nr:site-specific integrase [Helicobacter sp. 13S00401-1]PAF51093.1 hypothetical protein BKH43_02485 [Helicobacter sp. 13S00401-1]